MPEKSITIVNRHYPPNLNVTGENVWDMAKSLIEEHNISVNIVHVDREYTGGGIKREPVGIIHKVKTIYSGENQFLRYLAGLWDGYFLIRRAKALQKGPIIVLTSPPLLPMWASILLKNNDWILWSMDLFPEGYAAIGTIQKSNWLYKKLIGLTYKNKPGKIIALGPNQKKYIEANYNSNLEGVILPCGVFSENKKMSDLPAWKKDTSKTYIGYLGNCGIPHSPSFVKAAMDAINPSKQKMILVVYGVHAEELKKYAKDKDGIIIMDNVPRNELNHIDIHLVSLLNSWTHVAVPSKAVSSVCSGSAILFCGNKESDSYALLKEAAWQVDEDNTMKEKIKTLFDSISIEEIEIKKQKALNISSNLSTLVKGSYDEIATWAY